MTRTDTHGRSSYPTGGTTLFAEWQDLCTRMGLTYHQAEAVFNLLPRGAQYAVLDDLQRHIATAGTVEPC